MYVLVNDLLTYCVCAFIFVVVSKYPCVIHVYMKYSLDIRNGGLEFEETEF